MDILSDFAITDALKENLLKYLKAKLGRAREIITDDVNTITKFKEVLANNIVPENSKVIEGRITSLRYSFARQEEFASKVEELADALRRTLIIEGMTEKKANEMSIDKTVQLCRKSTNSDMVKSILAATAFKSPKEAIAKLITENDTHVREQQVLRYQRSDRNYNGHRNNNNNNNRFMAEIQMEITEIIFIIEIGSIAMIVDAQTMDKIKISIIIAIRITQIQIYEYLARETSRTLCQIF